MYPTTNAKTRIAETKCRAADNEDIVGGLMSESEQTIVRQNSTVEVLNVLVWYGDGTCL